MNKGLCYNYEYMSCEYNNVTNHYYDPYIKMHITFCLIYLSKNAFLQNKFQRLSRTLMDMLKVIQNCNSYKSTYIPGNCTIWEVVHLPVNLASKL